MNRWMKRAVSEAEKSTYKIKVGAVVFNKNSFVSCGHNYGNRSIKKHHPKFRITPNTVHAEVDAIINAKTDLKGMSILVIRINNNGEFRMSRPCQHCMAYLKHVGIKNIYYSISKYPYIVKEKI